MSPLAARPGRNAARQAKKLKEMRHVKNAIRFAERSRKQRQEAIEVLRNAKNLRTNRQRWENDNVYKIRRAALANAKEDWKLGPLRPNRAVGTAKDTYGALNGAMIQKPIVDEEVHKHRNEVRAKRGLDPVFPLIVDDKKYFPIVKGDRVTIIKGREAGKIGYVREIVPKVHDVIVSGLNMHYIDDKTFSSRTPDSAKRKNEVPIAFDNIRLVIPYATTSYTASGEEGFTSAQDVVVDKIHMERHTTGIDPFTGTDYGDAEIPANHQYDPRTGEPIFHRYIAGTKQRIEWPWERELGPGRAGKALRPKKERKSWFSKALGPLRHPITTLQRWTGTKANTAPANAGPDDDRPISMQLEELEAKRALRLRTKLSPRVKKPETYDGDTTRNIVEGAESMSYTLVAPPFPETLGDELRGDIHDFAIDARKDKDDPYNAVRPKITSAKQEAAAAYFKEKQRAALAMKTPMQLRWEAEQAKKKAEAPLVDTDSLLRALGKHMIKSKAAGKPKPKKASKKASKPKAAEPAQVAELD